MTVKNFIEARNALFDSVGATEISDKRREEDIVLGYYGWFWFIIPLWNQRTQIQKNLELPYSNREYICFGENKQYVQGYKENYDDYHADDKFRAIRIMDFQYLYKSHSFFRGKEYVLCALDSSGPDLCNRPYLKEGIRFWIPQG